VAGSQGGLPRIAVDCAHAEEDEIRQTDPEQPEHAKQDQWEKVCVGHDARVALEPIAGIFILPEAVGAAGCQCLLLSGESQRRQSERRSSLDTLMTCST
jgi:hypothetical protein